MDTLHIDTPENKTLFVVLTPKEGNALLNEQRYNLCEEVLNQHSFDFVTVDMEGEGKFNPKSLVKVIGKCPIESHGIDVPEFAMGYLQQVVDDLEEQASQLEIARGAMDPSSLKAQNMASWIEVLKEEAAEKRASIENDVKPRWMAKRIVDLVNRSKFDEIDEVYVLHFNNMTAIEALKAVFDEIDGVKCAVLDCQKATVTQHIFA